MDAERIEKAARAIIDAMKSHGSGDIRHPVISRWIAEAALRAAYPELADGRSVILPREASEAMWKAGRITMERVLTSPGSVYDAMRDAALSAPEST